MVSSAPAPESMRPGLVAPIASSPIQTQKQGLHNVPRLSRLKAGAWPSQCLRSEARSLGSSAGFVYVMWLWGSCWLLSRWRPVKLAAIALLDKTNGIQHDTHWSQSAHEEAWHKRGG